MGRCALAVEDPRRAQHERTRADRCRPRARLVGAAQPVQHLVVEHERPVPLAARHEDDGRVPHVGDGGVGVQPEPPGVGALESGLLGHEDNFRSGKAREHLVGSDRVQRRQPVEDQDRDPQAHTRTSPARSVAWPMRLAAG